MRLLLLLSALLTALTGVAVGGAASAQPVVASASATHVKPGAAVSPVAPLPEEVRGAFAAPGTWRTGTYPVVRSSRASYGERRRE